MVIKSVFKISGASRTSVGGYADGGEEDDSAQFEVSDNRPWMRLCIGCSNSGISPRSARHATAKDVPATASCRFVKSGQIRNCCLPNALMTLKEYAEDYASEDTKRLALDMIANEAATIPMRRSVKL